MREYRARAGGLASTRARACSESSRRCRPRQPGSCARLATASRSRRSTAIQLRARCVAVRCGALRCVAVRRGALQCGAVRRGAARCGAVRRGERTTIRSPTLDDTRRVHSQVIQGRPRPSAPAAFAAAPLHRRDPPRLELSLGAGTLLDGLGRSAARAGATEQIKSMNTPLRVTCRAPFNLFLGALHARRPRPHRDLRAGAREILCKAHILRTRSPSGALVAARAPRATAPQARRGRARRPSRDTLTVQSRSWSTFPNAISSADNNTPVHAPTRPSRPARPHGGQHRQQEQRARGAELRLLSSRSAVGRTRAANSRQQQQEQQQEQQQASSSTSTRCSS